MLLGIPQSMTGRGRYKKNVCSKQFSSLGTLHASRPTAICSDVMAVCSVQIEIHRSLCSLFQPDTDGTRVS